VRRLAELHGGRVYAHSEGRNRGAEFVVELPRHHATHSEPPMATFAGPPDSLRVMIVDDNRDAANTLAEVLRFYGHTVEALYSGADAVQSARRSAPDAILLDLAMPDKDGYQTARELRGLDSTATTFLVALSGYGQPRDRERSAESGFDAHLVKPVDIEQLVALLGRAHGRSPVAPQAGT
jgi:CheY-like chemotaxis protein